MVGTKPKILPGINSVNCFILLAQRGGILSFRSQIAMHRSLSTVSDASIEAQQRLNPTSPFCRNEQRQWLKKSEEESYIFSLSGFPAILTQATSCLRREALWSSLILTHGRLAESARASRKEHLSL